jgi:hypothetical protein
LFALSAARGLDYFQAQSCRKMKNIACDVLIFVMGGKMVVRRWITGFARVFTRWPPREITKSADEVLFRTIPHARLRSAPTQALLRHQERRACASKVWI